MFPPNHPKLVIPPNTPSKVAITPPLPDGSSSGWLVSLRKDPTNQNNWPVNHKLDSELSVTGHVLVGRSLCPWLWGIYSYFQDHCGVQASAVRFPLSAGQ